MVAPDKMSPDKSGRRRGKQGSVPSENNDAPKPIPQRHLSPYKAGFTQHLIDCGVYPLGGTLSTGEMPPEPDILDDFGLKLKEARKSLSPSMFSDDRFRELMLADANAFDEGDVMRTVMPIIEGSMSGTRRRAGNRGFTNLRPLTAAENTTLAPANPDLYHGARPDQIDLQVRTDVGDLVIPCKEDTLPAAPNFFMEVKGPGGTPRVALLQACYDGALGVRAMQSLRSYGGPDHEFVNKAYAVSFTYQAGHLRSHLHHLLKPAAVGARPEYAMTHVGSWSLIANPETCRQGIAALRNARDWARQHADENIKHANDRATNARTNTPSVAESSTQALAAAKETTGPTSQTRVAPESSACPASCASGTYIGEMSQGSVRSAVSCRGLPVIQRRSARISRSTSALGDDDTLSNKVDS